MLCGALRHHRIVLIYTVRLQDGGCEGKPRLGHSENTVWLLNSVYKLNHVSFLNDHARVPYFIFCLRRLMT